METTDDASLGPGFLDDLPIPNDTALIADKYRIIEVLGRGSFGIVYRARQENLDREVAVKTLRDGAFADEDEKELFLREAKSIAQLNHPNIVAIYDWGEDRGHPFFSMELVDGQSLAQRVCEQPLLPREAAHILQTVAEAMQLVHQQGMLHRDLKPGNILMTPAGVPKITDFGLAKRLRGDSSHTVAGKLLGSPGFMAPEQATGTNEAIGPHSDVYALGATLYCLLTTKAPFASDSLPEVLRQVVDAEPIRPRRLNHGIPPDLETITLKCLEKKPAQRYSSAQHLADDLGRFLRGEPIHARPTTTFEHISKWAHRRPAQALLGAALIAVLVIGGTIASIQKGRIASKTRSESVLLLKLANSLLEKASATHGEAQARLLNEAVAICKKVISAEPGSPEWGMAQNTLAVILNEQTAISTGQARIQLITESIEACQNALRVRSRDANPQEWGRTQNNLALALREQATMASGKEQIRLLSEATTAYENALEIFSRDKQPLDWAWLTHNLAIALCDTGNATQGPDCNRLFASATDACNQALTVFTRDPHPKMWALTQMTLSGTLRSWARTADKPQRADLLARAVGACRNALEVETRDATPMVWAKLKHNLAIMLADQAFEVRGAESPSLFIQARDAMQAARTIFTPDLYPAQSASMDEFISKIEKYCTSVQPPQSEPSSLP